MDVFHISVHFLSHDTFGFLFELGLLIMQILVFVFPDFLWNLFPHSFGIGYITP
jgi:hypothetical protein